MTSKLSDRLTRALDRLLRPQRHGSPRGTAPPAERPAGRIVWLRCTDPEAARALGGLLRHLGEALHDVTPLVTVQQTGPDAAAPRPDGVARGPRENAADLGRFLDHWRPVAAVLFGDAQLPATVQALHQSGVPVLAAGLRLPRGGWLDRRLARPLARRHWAQFRHLLTEDEASMQALRRAGVPPGRVSVGGGFAEEIPVPPANDAERASLAELMSARPVWCAVDLPEAEAPLLAEAQRQAHLGLHRLLLVVVPARIAEGAKMRDVFVQAGLDTGLRSAGDEPTEDVAVYIADLPDEAGLWLRLSPLAFLGGSLVEGAGSASPLVAAALGSAILHGPETEGHAAAYARLTAAGAARAVRSAADLAAAVDELSAPDTAAAMAHAAWEVASAGDEAAGRLVGLLAEVLAGNRPALANPAGQAEPA